MVDVKFPTSWFSCQFCKRLKRECCALLFFFLNPLRGWRTCYSSVPNKKSTRVRHLVSANFSCVQLILKLYICLSRSRESIKKPSDFKIPRKHQKTWFQDPKKASKSLLISRSQESIKKTSDFKIPRKHQKTWFQEENLGFSDDCRK